MKTVDQIMVLAAYYESASAECRLGTYLHPTSEKKYNELNAATKALRTAIEELYRDAAMQSAEIDELRKKLAALTRINSDLCRVHNERLLDKVRLATDAARYRAVRRGQKWSVVDGIGDTLRADDLDAAIDAAMKEST